MDGFYCTWPAVWPNRFSVTPGPKDPVAPTCWLMFDSPEERDVHQRAEHAKFYAEVNRDHGDRVTADVREVVDWRAGPFTK